MQRVLVFSAHMDDESIGCGGTLAKHARQGDEVQVVFMTTPNSGSTLQGNLSQAEYVQLRLREVERAMSILGASGYEYLEQDDGFLRSTTEVEKQLVAMIRRIAPGIVYYPHDREVHPDHIVTSTLATDAVRRAAWPHFPHLGREPHVVPETRAYEISTPMPDPNLYIDISDTADIKEKAIGAYESQLLHYEHQQTSRALSHFRGRSAAGVAFAEVFRRDTPAISK